MRKEEILYETRGVQRRIDVAKARFAQHDGNWHHPNLVRMARQADESIARSQQHLNKISYLVEHGANRQSAKEIIQARKLLKEAERLRRRAEEYENNYRDRVVEFVHSA